VDAALLATLARELGPGFSFAPEALQKVLSDDSTLPGRPEAVLRARNADEIATLVRLAGRYGFPVVPRGAGTGLSGGAVATEGGVVVTTEAMDRILALDTDNLVAVVEPGVVTRPCARPLGPRVCSIRPIRRALPPAPWAAMPPPMPAARPASNTA